MPRVRAFKAIRTKYLPATNKLPARIKAYSEAGSITEPWDITGHPFPRDLDRHNAIAGPKCS